MLLSPGDPDAPDSGVTKYRCNAKMADWYFCATCGVRCFIVFGKTEIVEVPVDDLPSGLPVVTSQDRIKVWRPVKEGWNEGPLDVATSYFSLNATTLDAGQGELDLRKFYERGWVSYFDSLDRVGEQRAGEPHRGGTY